MLIKRKSPPLPRNLAFGTFRELLIVFSSKKNLLYLLYSTTCRSCLLHLIKQNCLLQTILGLSNLDDLSNFLPVFPSGTNLKLNNTSVTHKLVEKVITNLDLSKACGPDFISAAV